MVALFLLLAATVGATTGVLGMHAWFLRGDNAQRMTEAFGRCGVSPAPPGRESLLDMNDFNHRAARCLAPIQWEQLQPGLWAVAGLAVLAVAFYCAYPWWLRRSRRLTPLRERGELAEYLAELRQVAGLRSRPHYLLGSLSGTADGVTFGVFRRRWIGLDAGLLRAFTTDRARFRAVVLHELAHAKGQDVHITYLTKSIWWAFLLLAWVPTAVVLAMHPSWWDLLVVAALLVLTALVLLTRNAILRQRELHADGVAAACGSDTALAELVTGHETRSWRRWVGHHPDPAWRRRVIAEPALLLRPRWWEMPVAGLAGGIIVTNLQYLVMTSLSTLSGLNGLVAGAFVAPSLVVPLVIAMWRVVARSPRERPVRTLLLFAAGVTAGYVVGEQVSVLALTSTGTESALESLDLTASVLLLVGAILVAAWATSAARSTFQSFDEPPRWALPVLAAAATAAFWLWFAAWFLWAMIDGLGRWVFVDDVAAYRLTFPDGNGWMSTAAHWLGLRHIPLYQMSWIPVVVPFLALLSITPIVITRSGRPVLGVGRALRAGLLGAAVFTVLAVSLVVVARTTLSEDVRGSDGFRVGFHLAVQACAFAVQAGVGAGVRTRHRAVLVPLAVVVSGLLSSLVALVGVEAMGRAVGLWVRTYAWLDLAFIVENVHHVVLTGAVFAAVGALLGAAVPARDTAPSSRRPVALALVAVATLALGVATVPNAYQSWVVSTRTGTVELTGAACLLGTWVETKRETTLTISTDVGPMTFEGAGTRQAFDDDGTVIVQFAPTSSVKNGHVVQLEYSGTVTARYSVEGDRILYSDVRPGITWSISVDGTPDVVTGEVTEFSPDTFSCKNNAMTQSGPNYSITLTRVANP